MMPTAAQIAQRAGATAASELRRRRTGAPGVQLARRGPGAGSGSVNLFTRASAQRLLMSTTGLMTRENGDHQPCQRLRLVNSRNAAVPQVRQNGPVRVEKPSQISRPWCLRKATGAAGDAAQILQVGCPVSWDGAFVA